MKYHKFSAIFPIASKEEMAGLVASIRQIGLLDPITTYKGQILDGRNRATACAKAGVSPRYGDFIGTEEEALELVWARGANRRHLTQSQIAIALAEKRKLEGECLGRGGNPRSPRNGTTRADAAMSAGVGKRTLESAEYVINNASKDVIEEVKKGVKSVDKAEREVKASKKIVEPVELDKVINGAQVVEPEIYRDVVLDLTRVEFNTFKKVLDSACVGEELRNDATMFFTMLRNRGFKLVMGNPSICL